MDYSKYIRVIEGFPTKEISFKDISPLLANPEAFRSAIKEMASYVKEWGADAIIGPESRGFIFGCPVALEAPALRFEDDAFLENDFDVGGKFELSGGDPRRRHLVDDEARHFGVDGFFKEDRGRRT